MLFLFIVLIMSLTSIGVSTLPLLPLPLLPLPLLPLPLLPLPDTSMNIINEITANNINPIIKIFCFFISFSSYYLNSIIHLLESVEKLLLFTEIKF
ncbi:hypothetical protein EUBVEN_01270 [Eubacterium ventriosum ATCC 27560]|uniref:Uncharacterized protein n=1 Tax=Eubacterium ventriosum ATCC 27560 TaxID=411463 RepID=A5Z6D8_9FIRM|nr:hypothetical protein EUBVEN_01270 [Eubacterium ventriosum ATCC 27560]